MYTNLFLKNINRFFIYTYITLLSFSNLLLLMYYNIKNDFYLFLETSYIENIFIETPDIGHLPFATFILTSPVFYYLLIHKNYIENYEKNIDVLLKVRKNNYEFIYSFYSFIIPFIATLLLQITNLIVMFLFLKKGYVSGNYTNHSIFFVIYHFIQFSFICGFLSLTFHYIYRLKINKYISIAICFAYSYVLDLTLNLGYIYRPQGLTPLNNKILTLLTFILINSIIIFILNTVRKIVGVDLE